MDLNTLPVWLVALLIFGLRVVDVSLGTFRTLSVVQGRTRTAVAVGLIEVSVWVVAVAQVVSRLEEHPWLILAYAGGFATGNAVGMALERRLAFGPAMIRMVTRRAPDHLQRAVEPFATSLSAFAGTALDGERRTLLYVSCRRRELPNLLAAARREDPDVFYVVERFSELGGLGPLPHATGWRAVLKKK